MATKPVKVLTDLQTRKQILKLDTNSNILFKVSGSLGDGVVAIELPVTASAGITARLYGTASYALNTLSSSYSDIADYSKVYTSGSVTGSGLISNPVTLTDPLIIGTISSSYLYVPQNLVATNITGNLYGTASYAENAGVNAGIIQNAYNRLRFQKVDYLDINGEATIELPSSSYGSLSFPTSSFDYINVTVFMKFEDRWVNDILAFNLYTSSTNVYIDLSAPGFESTGQYKLLAVNENPADYVVI